MFTYTKALPLALLISLPIFAMEDAVTASTAAKQKVAPELLSTIANIRQFETSSASCAELLATRETIDKKLTQQAAELEVARTALRAKISEADSELGGIKQRREEIKANQTDLDTEKTNGEAALAALLAKYNMGTAANKEKLKELDLEESKTTTNRQKLQNILDGKNTRGSWNPLSWFGSSSK